MELHEGTEGTVKERMRTVLYMARTYVRCGTYREGKVKGYYFSRTRMRLSLSSEVGEV